jgi:hypothetical protein
LLAGALCNAAALRREGYGRRISGDPIEGLLQSLLVVVVVLPVIGAEKWIRGRYGAAKGRKVVKGVRGRR